MHGVQLEPHEHVAKRVANQPARFSVFYDSSISNQYVYVFMLCPAGGGGGAPIQTILHVV